jgi:hypothetical protein
MIELTLPDGRQCRLEARRDPGTIGHEPPVTIVHCDVEGQESLAIPLHAGWAETAALPPGVADAIIRHFLME